MIGYKDDLDRDLVKAYANAGVVHIIAISGLHVGLIYWMLVQLCRPFRRLSYFKWFSPLLIIGGLWFFTLLAGAQASVLRSAIMFTAIVLEKTFSRKSTTMNSLAMSAFFILCINPSAIWDIGFQLSYAALYGILAFSRPIYNLFECTSKWMDMIWKMNAVTLAAQVFTTPLCIFYFHQFPLIFLITNSIAVPLSTLVLFVEILLLCLAWIPTLGFFTGKLTGWLIQAMNYFIEKLSSVSWVTWDQLCLNECQVLFLLLAALAFGFGLMFRRNRLLNIVLLSSVVVAAFRSNSFYQATRQQFLVV
jgi:competence protein ComEC